MTLQRSQIPDVLTTAIDSFWPAGPGDRDRVACVTLIRNLSECGQCSAGELVVLSRDATSMADVEAIIRALAGRHASAVLVPDAPFDPSDRERLRTLSQEHDLTIGLLGAHVDPILAANTLIRTHATSPAGTRRQTFQEVESLQRLAEMLGRLIGNSVTIESPNHELLAFSTISGPVDRPREETILRRAARSEALKWVVRAGYVNQVRRSDRPVRIPPNPDLDFSGRVAMRVAAEGETLAIIWATDTARPLAAEDELSLEQAAAAAATILNRQRETSRRRAQLVAELLDDVVQGRITSPEGIRSLAQNLGWDTDRRQQAMVVEIDSLEELRLRYAENSGQKLQKVRDRLTEIVQLETLAVDPDAIIGPRSTGVIVLFAQSQDDADARKATAQRLGDAIVQRVPALIPEMTVTIGIGREFATLLHTPESVRQAELAARLGVSLWGGNRATHYSDLGIHRALFALQEHEEMITPALQRLLDYDERHDSECVRTLAVYLECMGRLRVAAEQLNIHRNTLEYRIRRIEEVAGVSLEEPTNRLALELGIRVLELRRATEKAG